MTTGEEGMQGMSGRRLPVAVLAALALLVAGGGAAGSHAGSARAATGGVVIGSDSKHDVSPPVRTIPPRPIVGPPEHEQTEPKRAGEQPSAPDPVVQTGVAAPAMPSASLNFEGIDYPGVGCNCAPPDTNGEVGGTQYVQMVNAGFQVFSKTSGASVYGPAGIATLWSGFGGVCEANGRGDPVVLYDQLADRWLITEFAGATIPTDECIAVSTTSDAAGSYYRYAFHLGSNFFDYPKLGLWPDAYYMSMNVFNSTGTSFLGPQPFAFDRAAMLAGKPATFVTFTPLPSSVGTLLPADLDGSTPPPAGAPEPFLSATASTWPLYRFHVDFSTPASSTLTLAASLTPAGFSSLCPLTRSCVPQSGTTSGLDGLGDRAMFRLAYRRFADGHEALVGNRSVAVNSVAGIRWFEINNATSGSPGFVQQSTYQPDTTWRWLGSAAMDRLGDLAIGFSASSSSIFPQIRYAGRLAGDPLSTLSQGEATLFSGTGSQTGTSNRWGDYSDLTVDPADDCTFWYTSEYYSTTSSFNWRTRIGSFRFPGCGTTITVRKSLSPATDTGRFDLRVGSTVVKAAAGNGDSGSAGVGPGTYTVTEAGASGTNLASYTSSIACTVNGQPGPSANGTSVQVTVGGSDAVVCAIANARIGAIVEFATPTADSEPRYIAVGPDGNLWFTETRANKIGRITTGGTFTEFAIPTASSTPIGIASGPDGNVWFTEHASGKIGRVTPSGTFTEFSIPTPGSGPYGIVAGPDGNLWFSENGVNKVGRVTPSGSFTEFAVPSANGIPDGITVGPDGNLWITEVGAKKVARLTTAGAFTEFAVPSADVDDSIAAGSDGNLWFSEPNANKVGRLSTAGAFTEYTVPTAGSAPSSVAPGPDGNVWFTEFWFSISKIGRVTPAGSFTEFSTPTNPSQPEGITAGPDGNVWFAENGASKIGRLQTAAAGTTAAVTLRKALSPSSDSGRFDLRVDGALVKASAGNGDSGSISLSPGTHVLSEVGAGSTILSNYTSSLSCTLNGQPGPSGTGTSTQVTVVSGGALDCTFTNVRIAATATITVKKTLAPSTDAGRFDLRVGSTVVKAAAGNGGSGSTLVAPGTSTVSEVGANGTSLANYTSSFVCKKNGTTDVRGAGTSVNVSVAGTDSEVCTFTNKRNATVTLRKSLVPSADTGTFNLLAGGTTLASAVGNGGSGTAQVAFGTVTLKETAAGTTKLANYQSSISCTLNGQAGPSGSGTSLQVTLNPSDALDCTFTNTRLAKITVKKVVKPTGDTGTFDLLVGSTVVRAAATSGGSGTASVLAGTYTVSEAGANGTSLGSYTSSIACKKNGAADVSGAGTSISVTVAPADTEVCTITNTHV